MPKFEVSIPHSMAKQDVVERLQGFSAKIQEQHADKIKDFEQRWEGEQLHFGFKTIGMRIDGLLEVQDSAVRVEGNLPFAAAMFKGQISGAITEQLNRLLT